MNQVTLKRFRQVVTYGWIDSKKISLETGLGRLSVFHNILSAFRKYHLFSNQYRNQRFWELDATKQKEIGDKLGEVNRRGDLWLADNYRKWRFSAKWGDKKYEATPSGQLKRQKAYTKEFNAGKNLVIQYNVQINREHYLDGTISIGNNVIIGRNTFIDYSGHVIICDNVGISEGVLIESHDHPGHTNPIADIRSARQREMILEDGAVIGAKAVINSSTGCIGRYARVAAGAVVRHRVPPYAIVVGNPAKIVGFSMTPEQVVDFEKENYPEDKRISIKTYERDYNNLFINRLDEIKNFLKL